MSFWVRGNEFLGFGNEFHDFGNEFPNFGGNEFRPKRTKKKPVMIVRIIWNVLNFAVHDFKYHRVVPPLVLDSPFSDYFMLLGWPLSPLPDRTYRYLIKKSV